RFRWQSAAVCVAILLAIIGWIGWESNTWQTYLIKRDLRTAGNNFNNNDVLTEIAQAFIYSGDSQFALQVMERIRDDNYALREIAESYAKLGETMKDSALLVEAIKTAERISDDYHKTPALIAIAVSYAKLGDKEKASALLSEAIKTAER